jgi:lambda family phage portal protein
MDMAADGFTIGGSGSNATVHNAAGQGRRMRMFRAPNVGPNWITVGGQTTIVARTRDAVRNNPWAGAVVDKQVANEIGTGIQAKSKNGTKAQKALTKKKWDRWCKVCDADGLLNFDALQGLMDREAREAGEFFIRLRQRRPQDGMEVPLQLQVIEAEQCPVTYYANASNGNVIRAGIEFNQIGQRVAYWMYPQHPGDVMMTNFVSMQLRRIPADQIIHVFQPLRAGQIRGLPHLAASLVRMLNFDMVDDAVSMRQNIANLFTVFFVKNGGSPDDDPLKDAKTDIAPDGTPLASLEPGSAFELPEGYDVKFANPPDAGSNYAAYMRTQLLTIAARAGVPYEVLTGDLKDISDRALKLILNEWRRLIEQWQWHVIIPMCLQRIREAWFDAAVLAGAIDAPGYAEDREDYVETIWTPQGWPYSHPVQDVNADRIAVRSGFKSRQSIIESNGDDPEEVTSQQIEDNTIADEGGLIFDTDARYTSDKGINQAKPAGSVEPQNDPAHEDPATDPNAEPQQD